MKKTWSIEEKVSVLKDIEKQGVTEGCRKHGIYATTYYDWKKKYEKNGEEGINPRYLQRETRQIRNLEKENARLKQLLAEKEIELQIKGELLKKRQTMEECKTIVRKYVAKRMKVNYAAKLAGISKSNYYY